MTLSLGALEVTTVVATRFALDGGAMFGVVPKTLWSREIEADASNRIPLVSRAMLVTNRAAGYRALVDVGLGDAWSARERSLYALDGVSLADALRRAGHDPDSITDVVLTHLHWDHAGGVVTGDPASPVASLPRARVHVGAAHLAAAHRAAAKDRGSYRPGELAVASRAKTFEPGEVLPGLWATRSDGHTEGMFVIEARGDDARVVFPADLVPTRAHVRPAWGMAYDNFPLAVVDEKTSVIDRAARDGAIVVLEHDAAVAAVTVRIEDGRWTTADASAFVQ